MSDKESSEVKEGDVQLGSAAEATVMAYHQLAMDPGKRLHLSLDETCLQFLSLVIGNGDNGLVCKALTALTALAESPECRAPMASTFGVLHCLKASVEEDNDHTEAMKSQAAELFTCLNFAYHQQRAVRRRSRMLDPKPAESAEKDLVHTDTEIEKKPAHSKDTTCNNQPDCSGVEEAVKDDKETKRGCLVKSDSVESNCSTVSLSSNSQPSQRNHDSQCHNAGDQAGKGECNKYYRDPKHRTRMITLHIKGMVTPSERASVEAALVRVRGVISLVFDLPRSRVSCRVRRVLDLSKLGSAVDALDGGLFLYQVVAKSKGEEVEIPLSTLANAPAVDGRDSPPQAKSGCEVELPSYLPEDEDDECHGENDPNTAVAPVGVIREAASSLFSAAASLLQQSFYW